MAADLAGAPPIHASRRVPQARLGAVAGTGELPGIQIEGLGQRLDVVFGHERDLPGLNIAQPWPVPTDRSRYLCLCEAVQATRGEDQTAKRPAVNVVERTLL